MIILIFETDLRALFFLCVELCMFSPGLCGFSPGTFLQSSDMH